MPLLNHTLSRYFSNVVHHGHLEPSIFYHTSSLDAWPSELVDKPDRFVDKVEACFAHTMTPGLDGCPPIVDKEHHHTFLRIILVPSEDHPEETIFVERVLSQQDGATHSVIPVAMDAATASSGVRNTFHDHACIILEGSPSALIHAHHLKADRTTHVSDCRERRLSLFELATLLRFVSAHGLRAVSLGMDTECETYSRWFCRASMSALSVVMRGASRQLTPPKVGVATCIEQATQKSVDAWLNSTFKAYPAREVGAENLVSSFFPFLSGSHNSHLRGIDEAVERDERGGEREKIAASGQESGR